MHMRRFFASLLAGVILWNLVSPFITVTNEVQAHFVELTPAARLKGGDVLPVHLENPTGSFGIAFSTPENLEYMFEAHYKDPQNGQWSAWEPVYTDEDMTIPNDDKLFTQLIFAPLVQDVEIRLPATEAVSADFSHLELVTFAPQAKMQVGFAALQQAAAKQDGFIVTRQEWGADDNYLFADGWNKARQDLCKTQSWYCASSPSAVAATEKKSKSVADAFPEDVKIASTMSSVNGKDLAWPVQKSAKINKLFVHHTAELNKDQNGDGVINQTDEQIALRGIYYYHSVVRGWGDIGYNFIIGPTGTVYEGRYGGDKVVGAHAVWRNISSIGVSVMGNFEEETLSATQKSALAKALAYLSTKYSLDPTGTTFFYGKQTPTIQGHRDSDEAATACPGKDIYNQLDSIRKLTKDSMSGVTVTPSDPLGSTTNPKFTSSFLPPKDAYNFAPGETQTIKLSLTNTGTETWDTSTYLAIQNADTTAFRIQSGDKNASRAAVIDAITPPGDTAIFSLTIQSRYKGFTGNLQMVPMGGGKYVMSTFNVPVNMQKGTVSFKDAKATVPNPSYTFAEPIRGTVTLTNSGNTTWEKEGDSAAYLEIAASGADGKITALPTQALMPRDVAPNTSVDVPFEILAPLREGTFSMAFGLRIRNDDTLFGSSIRTQATIVHPADQSRLTLAFNELATPDLVTSIDTAGTYVMYVTNTGSTTWENLSLLEPDMHLASPVAGLEVSKGVFDDRTLAPGKTTALRFPFQTAYTASNAPIAISLDLGGKAWIKGITKSVTIQEKKIAGALVSPTVAATSAIANIDIKNTGDVTWHSGQVHMIMGDANVILGTDKDITPGNVATFQIRTDRIAPAGSPVSLQLDGRTDTITVGTLMLRAAPQLFLEFGSHLQHFPIL